MSENKRAVINLTEEQREAIQTAASKVGLSVPAYMKLKSLEAARA